MFNLIASMDFCPVKAVRVQFKAVSTSVMLTRSELCQSQPAGKQLVCGTTGDECSEPPTRLQDWVAGRLLYFLQGHWL